MNPEQRIAIVKDFLNKLGALEIGAACEHVAEDAVMLFPYLSQPGPYEGRQRIFEQFNSTLPAFWERMEFSYRQWYSCDDDTTVIGEFDSRAIQKGNTGTYANQYIAVFQFRGDKLTLIKEYFNPALLTVKI